MTVRAFDHVLVIMFENQYRGYVKENPYFARLAREGVELENAFGVMHPSQTNYIASIAGELCGVTSDDPPGPLPQQTIVDLVEGAGFRATGPACATRRRAQSRWRAAVTSCSCCANRAAEPPS
jgi:hypothetical protein